jgi:hypothetical protein
MPTIEELKELRDTRNCTWTWTTQNGVKGYKVTSVVNGNSIFLPAAGYRAGVYLRYDGSSGHYWTSSLYTSENNYAYSLNFFSSSATSCNEYRYTGRSVRAVCE